MILRIRTETALINLGTNLGIDAMQVRERYPRLSEVPFDSDRKLMSTAHNMNDALLQEGHMMIVKGAVDVLLERMDRIRVGNTVRRMTDSDREDIAVQNMQFSREGLRVLAFDRRHRLCIRSTSRWRKRKRSVRRMRIS